MSLGDFNSLTRLELSVARYVLLSQGSISSNLLIAAFSINLIRLIGKS